MPRLRNSASSRRSACRAAAAQRPAARRYAPSPPPGRCGTRRATPALRGRREQDVRAGGLVLDVGEEGLDRRADPRLGRARRSSPALRGSSARRGALHEGGEQRALGREVVVEHRLGDARGLAPAVHARQAGRRATRPRARPPVPAGARPAPADRHAAAARGRRPGSGRLPAGEAILGPTTWQQWLRSSDGPPVSERPVAAAAAQVRTP
jgi:hypothetical protein